MTAAQDPLAAYAQGKISIDQLGEDAPPSLPPRPGGATATPVQRKRRDLPVPKSIMLANGAPSDDPSADVVPIPTATTSTASTNTNPPPPQSDGTLRVKEEERETQLRRSATEGGGPKEPSNPSYETSATPSAGTAGDRARAQTVPSQPDEASGKRSTPPQSDSILSVPARAAGPQRGSGSGNTTPTNRPAARPATTGFAGRSGSGTASPTAAGSPLFDADSVNISKVPTVLLQTGRVMSARDLSDAKKSGLLKKQGGKLQLFQSRFIVVRRDTLSYYKSATEDAPQGVVPLSGCRVTESDEVAQDTIKKSKSSTVVFHLTTPKGRTFVFKTGSAEERAAWVAVITQQIAVAVSPIGALFDGNTSDNEDTMVDDPRTPGTVNGFATRSLSAGETSLQASMNDLKTYRARASTVAELIEASVTMEIALLSKEYGRLTSKPGNEEAAQRVRGYIDLLREQFRYLGD